MTDALLGVICLIAGFGWLLFCFALAMGSDWKESASFALLGTVGVPVMLGAMVRDWVLAR